MCVKIIGSQELECDPNEPLELQVSDAKEVIVNYDPIDPKIDYFVEEIERFVKNGISFTADIKFNPNNSLNGIRLERKLEKLKIKLGVNEIVKSLSNSHNYTDKKLCEI